MGSEDPGGLGHRRRANEPAYVLFASTFAREFYAVVPTYNPIPNLLLSPGWRFVRILKGRSARQPCLRGMSAMTAFAQEGYYLFANRQFIPERAKLGPQIPNAKVVRSSRVAGQMIGCGEAPAMLPNEGATTATAMNVDNNRAAAAQTFDLGQP